MFKGELPIDDYDSIEEEINQIENLDEYIQKKKKALAKVEEKMQELGQILHEKRIKIAKILENQY